MVVLCNDITKAKQGQGSIFFNFGAYARACTYLQRCWALKHKVSLYTVCTRILDPIYDVTYYIKGDKTSWTDSRNCTRRGMLSSSNNFTDFWGGGVYNNLTHPGYKNAEDLGNKSNVSRFPPFYLIFPLFPLFFTCQNFLYITMFAMKLCAYLWITQQRLFFVQDDRKSRLAAGLRFCRRISYN